MLKRGNGKTYRLYKKEQKSFAKVLDIKQPIGQNLQLYSFTALQLYSFTALQLYSFTALQLYSFTAEGYLCPNNIIKHIQFFSHKKTHTYFKSVTHLIKPQGTQSVELRSTSQRNNRNVLSDWDSSIQTK